MENAMVKVGSHQMQMKIFNDRPVVTFKDIDTVHERPEGTASRNFRKNKQHFIENEDFYSLTPNKFQSDEIRRFGIDSPRGGILITETGYLMLVKSFTDNLAWDIQRSLVNNYFRHKTEASNASNMVSIDYVNQQINNAVKAYVEPLHNDFNRNMNMIYNAFIGVQKALPQIASIQSISLGDKEWKQKQFNTINELLKECPEYKKCNLVLRKIYSKMRNQYGVVFEQEYKDYCKRHNVSGHIPVIEVVSDKEMLRSIFSSILDDLFVLPKEIIKKSKRQSVKSNINNVVDNDWLREPLKPLIKKYNDNSAHSNMTFRRVYKEMANMGVCWHNRQVRYKNKYNLKNYPLKSKLIRNNHALYDIFYKAIENLLTE